MWKIKLPHLVFGFLSLFALPFILSSGSVSASSQTINPVVSSTPQTIDFTQFSFTPSYVVFDFDYSSATTFQQINSSVGVSTNISGNSFNTNYNDTFCQLVLRRNYKPSSLICMVDPTIITVYRIYPVFSDQFSVGVSMTFYDVLPGVSEPCPECPVVPDNPYDDKLDSINRSILIVSATALVIYFFFAIYSMFFGGIR